jgi:hypothetical protein
MVGFAAAASQNGFSTLVGRLFLYKKTNIIQKMTKNIRFFYYFRLYHGAVVNQDAAVAKCTEI